MSFKVVNVYENYTVDKAKYDSKIAVLSMYTNYTQSIPVETDTKVRWYDTDYNNSCGNSELELTDVNTRFINTSTTKNIYSINGYVGWNTGATTTSSRVVFIVKNSNTAGNQGRISYSNYQAGSDYPVTSFNGTIILKPNEYFEIFVWHNDESSQQINDQTDFPGSRINILKHV